MRSHQFSNRVSGTSTSTMHQSTTPSLPQTIWPKWASRQCLTLPILQTLLPGTFAYSLISEAIAMKQLRRWKRLWWRSLMRSQRGLSWGLPEVVGTVQQVNGGDYCEGDLSFMCILSIKVPIQRKSGTLFNDPRMYIYRNLGELQQNYTKESKSHWVPIYTALCHTYALSFVNYYIYIFLSLCLLCCISMSFLLNVSLCLSLSILLHLSVSLPFILSHSLTQSLFLSLSLSLSLSLCASFSLFSCLFLSSLFVYLWLFLSLSLSKYIFFLCVWFTLDFFLSLSMSFCLFLYVCLLSFSLYRFLSPSMCIYFSISFSLSLSLSPSFSLSFLSLWKV